MYAQLCKRLSEEAPNSEPPGQPCTFKVLLLNKCQDEFENRAQAFAAYEHGLPLSPDDEEKRHIAKCKMLGNIKFIGELGKLEILSEAILHRCIQALLARRGGGEAPDDLECLAQLVRTCGRVLDSARGRGLMDQYFARIEGLSVARHLAPRIRFMLRDTIELRRGGWVPRAAAASDPPVPMHQLRPEDDAPPPPPPDPLFRRARPLDDVLAGLALSSSDHPTPPDKLFGNGFGSRLTRGGPPQPFSRGASGFGGGTKSGGGGNGSSKDAAPRLARSRLAAAPALSDVQMRPAANSLLFTANKLSNKQTQPMPLQPVQQSAMNTSGFTTSAASLVKEPIAIKPAQDKKEKPKKDKGHSKEEATELGAAAAAQACAAGAVEGEALAAAAASLAPLTDKLLRRALAAALDHVFTHAHEEENENGGAEEGDKEGEEGDGEGTAPGGSRRACARGVVALVRAARRGPLADTLRVLLTRHPHPALAHTLAQAVIQKVVGVSEVGAWCGGTGSGGGGGGGEEAGGARWELFLDVLGEVRRELGMTRLAALLEEARVALAPLLRAAGAPDAAAAAALSARRLQALAPVLHLQAELLRTLEGCGGEGGEGASPAELWRWVKGVDAAARAHPAFVGALVEHVAAHVTRACGTHGPAPPRVSLDKEAALAEGFAPLLAALTRTRADAQLAAVYATQMHAHSLRYPRGLLLRWFMYLYNLEVCEEDAFLRWREDVTDKYPGKGEALFQVNAWLTWLQQQESEDEEEEGED